MDFRGRSSQPSHSANTTATPAAPAAPGNLFANNQLNKLAKGPRGKLFSLASVILLFSVAALVIAVTFLLVFNGNHEERSISKKSYQAVFLNNGQVYFGNIKSFDGKTVDLRNIYYLQTNSTSGSSTSTPSNVSLAKLGCELHAPFDEMLINRDQVIFWENIQDSSQVVTAINKYKKDNNNKINCSQQNSNSAEQAPSTSSSTGTTAAPTTTTAPVTTKKP